MPVDAAHSVVDADEVPVAALLELPSAVQAPRVDPPGRPAGAGCPEGWALRCRRCVRRRWRWRAARSRPPTLRPRRPRRRWRRGRSSSGCPGVRTPPFPGQPSFLDACDAPARCSSGAARRYGPRGGARRCGCGRPPAARRCPRSVRSSPGRPSGAVGPSRSDCQSAPSFVVILCSCSGPHSRVPRGSG